MELLNPNSYQKGSWVLHMLRREVGDSMFWNSIRTYYATYAGKTADSDDLRKVFESVSGKDLKQFFQQWLYTPGLPILDIKWSYLEKDKQVSVTVKQLQKTGLFSFPLDLAIEGNTDTKFRHTINNESETFIIPVKSRPVKIIADPYTSLLFDGMVTEQK
jgi:aminopeptidase N